MSKHVGYDVHYYAVTLDGGNVQIEQIDSIPAGTPKEQTSSFTLPESMQIFRIYWKSAVPDAANPLRTVVNRMIEGYSLAQFTGTTQGTNI